MTGRCVFFLGKLRKVVTWKGVDGVVLTIRGAVRFIPLSRIEKRHVRLVNPIDLPLNRSRLQYWIKVLSEKPTRSWNPIKLLKKEKYLPGEVNKIEYLLTEWVDGNMGPLRNALTGKTRMDPVMAAVVFDYYHMTQAGLRVKFPTKETFTVYRGVPAKGVISLIRRDMTVPPIRSYTSRLRTADWFSTLEDVNGIRGGAVVKVQAPRRVIFHSDDVFPFHRFVGEGMGNEKEYILLTPLKAEFVRKPRVFVLDEDPNVFVDLTDVPVSEWPKLYEKILVEALVVKLHGKAYTIKKGKVKILDDESFNWLSIVRELRKRGLIS